MDIFLPIVICVVIFIIFSICGWCCKKNRQGSVYGTTPVTVTTYGVVNPPYPVDVPVAESTGPGYVVQPGYPVGPYTNPTQPYPPQTYAPGYPPAPGGYPEAATPYPPMPMPMPPTRSMGSTDPPYPVHPAQNQQPPSYAEAVNQPPTTEVYAKQAPYNPNF